MKTFKELFNESLKCNSLSAQFSFSGSIEQNESAFIKTRMLINADCDTLVDLYCCIQEHIKPNFCKNGNMSRIRHADKLLICKALNDITATTAQVLKRECDVADCSKRF